MLSLGPLKLGMIKPLHSAFTGSQAWVVLAMLQLGLEILETP
jgi:hypothetical protein